MTNEKLLRLAEALEIDEMYQHGKSDGRSVFPNYHIDEFGKCWYWESVLSKKIEWSIDGPDMGNVAAVVIERLQEMESCTTIMGRQGGDGSFFIARVSLFLNGRITTKTITNKSFPLALIEAACKALGVEG